MDPSISFLQAIIAIPIFIILFIQIVYLNTVLENKTVSKQLEINYYNTTITNIVLFSILIVLSLLFMDSNKYFIGKIIIILFSCSILALNIYNYVILSKGENLSRGAIITNLIFIYPLLLLTVILLASYFGPEVYRIVDALVKN
jgi:hypothetical protein